MGINEKQFGVRLKDPTLAIIEKRTEAINVSTPETKITAGGVARYAVEEYAKQLDRKLIETQLSFQFIGGHEFFHYNGAEDVIKAHPFITKGDLEVDYSLDELELLSKAFKTISDILETKPLPKEKKSPWKSLSNKLEWEFNHFKSGIDEANERAEWEANNL